MTMPLPPPRQPMNRTRIICDQDNVSDNIYESVPDYEGLSIEGSAVSTHEKKINICSTKALCMLEKRGETIDNTDTTEYENALDIGLPESQCTAKSWDAVNSERDKEPIDEFGYLCPEIQMPNLKRLISANFESKVETNTTSTRTPDSHSSRSNKYEGANIRSYSCSSTHSREDCDREKFVDTELQHTYFC